MVNFMELPNPVNHGWKKTEFGDLFINWCDDDILPSEIVDILADEEDKNEHTNIKIWQY